jgi:hypothetical protein
MSKKGGQRLSETKNDRFHGVNNDEKIKITAKEHEWHSMGRLLRFEEI